MDNNSHIMGDRSNSVAGSRRCYCSLCGWMSPSKPPRRPETVYFPYQIGGDWWSVCLYAGIYATIAISNPLNMFGLLSWLPDPLLLPRGLTMSTQPINTTGNRIQLPPSTHLPVDHSTCPIKPPPSRRWRVTTQYWINYYHYNYNYLNKSHLTPAKPSTVYLFERRGHLRQ